MSRTTTTTTTTKTTPRSPKVEKSGVIMTEALALNASFRSRVGFLPPPCPPPALRQTEVVELSTPSLPPSSAHARAPLSLPATRTQSRISHGASGTCHPLVLKRGSRVSDSRARRQGGGTGRHIITATATIVIVVFVVLLSFLPLSPLAGCFSSAS